MRNGGAVGPPGNHYRARTSLPRNLLPLKAPGLQGRSPQNCFYTLHQILGDRPARYPLARVRITVSAGSHGLLIREGTGAGHGIDTDLGLAHESAIKEAETDSIKRALMTFGNPFGLEHYDKSLSQVKGPEAPAAAQGDRGQLQAPANGVVRLPGTATPNPVAAAINGLPRETTAPAPSQAPTALTPKTPAAPVAQNPTAAAPDYPLDPPTIRSLQERILG